MNRCGCKNDKAHSMKVLKMLSACESLASLRENVLSVTRGEGIIITSLDKDLAKNLGIKMNAYWSMIKIGGNSKALEKLKAKADVVPCG